MGKITSLIGRGWQERTESWELSDPCPDALPSWMLPRFVRPLRFSEKELKEGIKSSFPCLDRGALYQVEIDQMDGDFTR